MLFFPISCYLAYEGLEMNKDPVATSLPWSTERNLQGRGGCLESVAY